jgi:hypothetical protein
MATPLSASSNNNGLFKDHHSTSASEKPQRVSIRRLLTLVHCLVVCLTVWNLSEHTPPISNNNEFVPSNIEKFPHVKQTWRSPPPLRLLLPTHHACDGYRGIYHIEKGDIGGAAGTVFFQFVIGQIMWAEQHNFKPWVHLNNVSHVVYDPHVHGQGDGVTFTMQKGLGISYNRRPMGHRRDAYPGPPVIRSKLQPYTFHFDGDGVWQNYFEPVSDFVPGDKSCEKLPLVTMDLYLVTPGVHGFAPWAPKCWRYHYLPDYITKPHLPITEWLAPQRHAAHDVLTRYIRFQTHIQERAELFNPNCSWANSCLGIHIRQSDKAAGRRQIQTDEFLPYVEAFLDAGGKWVYLATDSGNVVQRIQSSWPERVRNVIRSMGDEVVRSNNSQAVFEIGSHHRTNTEILTEILALSKCQFMIHGLSAVSESSIWINEGLHDTSVNLEDPERLSAQVFEDLVGQVLRGGNATQFMLETRPPDWWKRNVSTSVSKLTPTNAACKDVDGILHIAKAGPTHGIASAFFTSVLNQLIYAEMYGLKPWIYLDEDSNVIYDDGVHGTGKTVYRHGPISVSIRTTSEGNTHSNVKLQGDGIWSSYFKQVSDFVPGDKSCTGKPFLSMDAYMVTPGMNSWAPWSVKAWQYDDIPNYLWKPKDIPLQAWLEPMRSKAHEIVRRYYKFDQFIVDRAKEVNPVNGTTRPCLAVHLRNTAKDGVHREKFPPKKFLEYFVAFARAGGKDIYIASDSSWTLEYIDEHFSPAFKPMIRTQGKGVVRSSWKWPTHMLEKHHRTNSETLVDILAMSKCQMMLHGSSAVSEAAIYLNFDLHGRSVNLEDPDRMNADAFENVARQILGTVGQVPVDVEALERQAIKGDRASKALNKPRIIMGDYSRKCHRNAIVYLAQKHHSSYGRDSFGILLESLRLMNDNYLSLHNHRSNTDVMIFHTADFKREDMDLLESLLGPDFRAAVRFIDLSNTTYWQRPSWHREDDPLSWFGKLGETIFAFPILFLMVLSNTHCRSQFYLLPAFPQFSEGYRRMMHWYAIDIWQYFQDYGEETGCKYEYVMRFDEDSFLHSPVDYDVFDFMRRNDYNYGFRLCAYELAPTRRIWKLWRSSKSPPPVRDIDLEMCGMYNNFFVAKLAFFQSGPVQRFLKFVDRQGMIYRRRLGDLMIHSLSIYAFSPPDKIHRFLDFTYEHGTVDKETGCVVWGGIQAGYNDPNASETLRKYMKLRVSKTVCNAKVTFPSQEDLSPTYQHLPPKLEGKVRLHTIMAGMVELPGKGLLSG